MVGLSGTVALVTGASGTVGAGIAREFALAGAAVALHYRHGADRVDALAAEIEQAGGTTWPVTADLSTEAGCDAAIDSTITRYGRLDALVNNAGVQPTAGLPGMDLATWRSVVDTNLTSVFACTQAAARWMRANGGGSVTHISSIEGSQPARDHAHYNAAKAAIIMHARSAALEYGPDGIRVNTVSPGLIDPGDLDQRWPDGVARWHRAAPLGRLGTARDVGAACVFLASTMASWITGADLVVDGGVSCHPTW